MTPRPGPRHPRVGVIGLVPDRWRAPWMPRHHVMSRLASHFHVVWLDPVPHWRDLLRHPLAHAIRSERPRPGFTVQRRDLLPRVHRLDALGRAARRRRLRAARESLRRRGCSRIVLYVWRPAFGRAVDEVPHDLTCYHVDDEYSFSRRERETPEAELALLRAADQVFVHSPALLRKKGGINPHTAFVPNGVDYRAFATPVEEPADLRAIARPRIGYAGMLKRQLDWHLLRRLAAAHPEWSFAFVGPVSPHPEVHAVVRELSERDNVHFLGPKKPRELGRYPQHFDVCIMPYRRNGYTKFIYPMKLHEYLAGGRPVVGTSLPSLEEFSGVLLLPSDADGWSDAVRAALDPSADTPERREARREVARRHDWDHLVGRIADRILARLGEKEEPPRGF